MPVRNPDVLEPRCVFKICAGIRDVQTCFLYSYHVTLPYEATAVASLTSLASVAAQYCSHRTLFFVKVSDSLKERSDFGDPRPVLDSSRVFWCHVPSLARDPSSTHPLLWPQTSTHSSDTPNSARTVLETTCRPRARWRLPSRKSPNGGSDQSMVRPPDPVMTFEK